MRIITRFGGYATALLAAGAAGLAVPAVAQASAAAPALIGVPCSSSALIAAIGQANSLGFATLHLSQGCHYVLTSPAEVANGLPTITGNIVATGGQGTEISRDPSAALFRIINVGSGGRLVLGSVTVADGHTSGLGGGILDGGSLVLRDVTLTGNTAGNGGGLAVSTGARATVSGSAMTGNDATSVGGGAVINSGQLTVDRSELTWNTAPINGGAVNTQPGGTSRINLTVILHNHSGGLGGGLSNLGTTLLTRDRVQFNHGSSGGGLATGNQNAHLLVTQITHNTPDNCNPLSTLPGCFN
jgi:hypothetical protein